jgi:isopenicillin N synthase-like dioxygenase
MDTKTIAELSEACSEVGLFRLVECGIAVDQINDFFEKSRSFFSLSPETKRVYSRTEEKPLGFFDRELTKNRADWKEIFDLGVESNEKNAELETPWPAVPSGFRESALRWHSLCNHISLTVIRALCVSLGEKPDRLSAYFEPTNTSFLRLNYYPLCSDPATSSEDLPEQGHLGIHHHTDAGAVTVLLQDKVAGLQFKHHDEWCLVPTNENELVVNLGDLMQVWSNGMYQSPVHRVLANSQEERFSSAYFMNPIFSTDCLPLLDDEPKYKVLNWGEYRSGRAAGDYSDLGEEIQVDHFRL